MASPRARPLVAPLVLLEDLLAGGEARSRVYAGQPETALCSRPDELGAFFGTIQDWQRRGRFIVLLLDYEFGELLNPAGCAPPGGAPCARALAFESVQHATEAQLDERIDAQLKQRQALGAPAGVAAVQPGIARARYGQQFQRVQRYIRDGHTYQINLTLPLRLRWFGEPLGLYRQLRARQKVSYASYIELHDRTIVSLSPELFVQRRGAAIRTRPMKGTRPRGADAHEDRQLAEQMLADPKSRAENLMIVDLLRNDLGRICEVGSVRVSSLFDIETFGTVLQMTSTVQGHLAPGTGFEPILRALFPCGSVTGAPKHRSRQIIAELEQRRRGIYTGSIGFLDPDGALCLNVAIRTLELQPDGTGELGIGGGLVADSGEQDEWEECLLKARFLTRTDPGFELLETMRADLPADAGQSRAPTAAGAIALWERHWRRLQRSAAWFGYCAERERVEADLAAAMRALAPGCWRVRLCLNKGGSTRIGTEALAPQDPAAPRWVALAAQRIHSDAWYQSHKTTWRPLYEAGLRQAQAQGLWDLLYLNERDELVEGSRSSVFLKIDGRLVTPALDSGALPGVMREQLLADASLGAVERTVTAAELRRAEQLWLCNALRGLLPVQFKPL